MAIVEWYSGDTNSLTVTVTEGGVAVESLAGATFSGAIVDRVGGAALVELEHADFSVAANVATAYPDTSALAGIYITEVQVVDADGNVQTSQAPVRINKDQIA